MVGNKKTLPGPLLMPKMVSYVSIIDLKWRSHLKLVFAETSNFKRYISQMLFTAVSLSLIKFPKAHVLDFT